MVLVLFVLQTRDREIYESNYELMSWNVDYTLHTDCQPQKHPSKKWPKPRLYANMPMQYTGNLNGCKNDNFQLKFFKYFLIFAQNIDCGYMLVRRF